PDLVCRIVESAGRPDRPVEEVVARVARIGVVVEHVVHGEAADLDGQAIDVALARHLPIAALDLVLAAAKPEGLPQEQPRGAVARKQEARLLRLAVGIAGEADGVAQAEALQELGVVVELAAIPKLDAEESAGAPDLARLRPRCQAVRPRI